MLILRSSPASPFARKVRVAAGHLGLADRIEVAAADTSDPEEELRTQNPLGKIPTLVLEDGRTLFDSRVILEYLDHMAGGGRILPQEPEARFAALRLQALADGVMDAAITQMYERRFRPEEKVHQPWLDYQAEKVSRALHALEHDLPHDKVDVGTIALACVLGYLDFRFRGEWRDSHPRLVAWLDQFAANVHGFGETAPA